jgi:hypothetical protein
MVLTHLDQKFVPNPLFLRVPLVAKRLLLRVLHENIGFIIDFMMRKNCIQRTQK